MPSSEAHEFTGALKKAGISWYEYLFNKNIIVICDDGGFCKRLEGQRRDKLAGVVCHNNVHVCAQFFEPRHDFARFVNGNAAAYAQNHVFSVQHNKPRFNRDCVVIRSD